MKPKELKKPREVSQLDLTINAVFMMSLSMELMIRDIEREMAHQGAAFQKEAKQKFTRFLDFTKKALFYAEELTQEIYKVDAEVKWKNIPVWQEESNELARLILLYADKSADVDNVEAIFKMLRELPGEGIVDEEMLKRFYLNKGL